MAETISLRGKRASATIFISNLILDRTYIALLSAYGPSQEVRAFAQILFDRDAPYMEVPGKKSCRVAPGGTVRLISKMDNGYTGLYLIPDQDRRLIVGTSKEECFDIYSRMLDQQQFVHRDWYGPLFDLAEELAPLVGNKTCYRYIENVSEEVRNRIKYGSFKFPEATASFTIETNEKKSEPTEEAA